MTVFIFGGVGGVGRCMMKAVVHAVLKKNEI